MSRLVLASASPRRKELMEQIGLVFTVRVSDMPERTEATEAGQIVLELSKQKAANVWDILDAEESVSDTVVIGADTVVSAPDTDSVPGGILGKPKDKEDARRMLSLLQGRTHQVYTGVTVYWMEDRERRCFSFVECTDVTMYPMDDEDISAYIATGEPMDKAGAYGIQGRCAAYVRRISGDYNNVVGLPVSRLYQELCKRKLL